MEQLPAVPGRTVEAVSVAPTPIHESGTAGLNAATNDPHFELRANELPSHPPLPLYTLFTTLLI
jgi:hypothetical protein